MSDVSEILPHSSDIGNPREPVIRYHGITRRDGESSIVGSVDYWSPLGTVTVPLIRYDGGGSDEPERYPTAEEMGTTEQEQERRALAEVRLMRRERAELIRTLRVARARRPMTIVIAMPRRAPCSGRAAGRPSRTRRSSGSRGDPPGDGEPEPPPVAALRDEVAR